MGFENGRVCWVGDVKQQKENYKMNKGTGEMNFFFNGSRIS